MFVHNGRYYLQNEDLKVNQTYLFKNRKVNKKKVGYYTYL